MTICQTRNNTLTTFKTREHATPSLPNSVFYLERQAQLSSRPSIQSGNAGSRINPIVLPLPLFSRVSQKGDEAEHILDVERSDSLVDGAEDAESVTEHSDSASVQDSEYVNPQGVRFTPHHRHKDGETGIYSYSYLS